MVGRSGPNLALAALHARSASSTIPSPATACSSTTSAGSPRPTRSPCSPTAASSSAAPRLPLNGKPRNLVARFTAAGSLDSTFGSGGRRAHHELAAGIRRQHGARGNEAGGRRHRRRRDRRDLARTTRTARSTRPSGPRARPGRAAARSLASPISPPTGRDASSPRVRSPAPTTSPTSRPRPPCSATRRTARPMRRFGCSGSVLTEMLGNGFGTQYNASAAIGRGCRGQRRRRGRTRNSVQRHRPPAHRQLRRPLPRLRSAHFRVRVVARRRRYLCVRRRTRVRLGRRRTAQPADRRHGRRSRRAGQLDRRRATAACSRSARRASSDRPARST